MALRGLLGGFFTGQHKDEDDKVAAFMEAHGAPVGPQGGPGSRSNMPIQSAAAEPLPSGGGGAGSGGEVDNEGILMKTIGLMTGGLFSGGAGGGLGGALAGAAEATPLFQGKGGGPAPGSVMQFIKDRKPTIGKLMEGDWKGAISERNPALGQLMEGDFRGALDTRLDQRNHSGAPPPPPVQAESIRALGAPGPAVPGGSPGPVAPSPLMQQFGMFQPGMARFADGGTMTVPGDPRQGPDSALVQFHATPGETVEIKQPKSSVNINIASVDDLRAVMAPEDAERLYLYRRNVGGFKKVPDVQHSGKLTLTGKTTLPKTAPAERPPSDYDLRRTADYAEYDPSQHPRGLRELRPVPTDHMVNATSRSNQKGLDRAKWWTEHMGGPPETQFSGSSESYKKLMREPYFRERHAEQQKNLMRYDREDKGPRYMGGYQDAGSFTVPPGQNVNFQPPPRELAPWEQIEVPTTDATGGQKVGAGVMALISKRPWSYSDRVRDTEHGNRQKSLRVYNNEWRGATEGQTRLTPEQRFAYEWGVSSIGGGTTPRARDLQSRTVATGPDSIQWEDELPGGGFGPRTGIDRRGRTGGGVTLSQSNEQRNAHRDRERAMAMDPQQLAEFMKESNRRGGLGSSAQAKRKRFDDAMECQTGLSDEECAQIQAMNDEWQTRQSEAKPRAAKGMSWTDSFEDPRFGEPVVTEEEKRPGFFKQFEKDISPYIPSRSPMEYYRSPAGAP